MSGTYTTIQGETWDNIALKVYGSEKYTSFLMGNNYPHLDILVFPSGTVLKTPDLPEETSVELPPWRDGTEDDDDVDPYDDYNDEDEADEEWQ